MMRDPFLEKRVIRYDRWLKQGKIAYSAKVVPVSQSIETLQWVLPTERAQAILRRAAAIAVQPCECRTHYGRCDKPREVCLLLDDIADHEVAQEQARRVSLSAATTILERANASGLVHLTLYRPDHRVFALCSCCSCCCHDLQIIHRYGRNDLIRRSDYVAATDRKVCTTCGICVQRCIFGARTVRPDRLIDDAGACIGCGLCVTICPQTAIVMEQRK